MNRDNRDKKMFGRGQGGMRGGRGRCRGEGRRIRRRDGSCIANGER